MGEAISKDLGLTRDDNEKEKLEKLKYFLDFKLLEEPKNE